VVETLYFMSAEHRQRAITAGKQAGLDSVRW
jgi:hypothetical protein